MCVVIRVSECVCVCVCVCWEVGGGVVGGQVVGMAMHVFTLVSVVTCVTSVELCNLPSLSVLFSLCAEVS